MLRAEAHEKDVVFSCRTVRPVFAVQYSFSNIVMNGGLVPYGNRTLCTEEEFRLACSVCVSTRKEKNVKMPYEIKTLSTEEVFYFMSLYAHGKDVICNLFAVWYQAYPIKRTLYKEEHLFGCRAKLKSCTKKKNSL